MLDRKKLLNGSSALAFHLLKWLLRTHELIGITVYIGFYDQTLSQGSRSLNPIVVAKLSMIFAWFNNQVVAKNNADYTPLGIATCKSVEGRYFAT